MRRRYLHGNGNTVVADLPFGVLLVPVHVVPFSASDICNQAVIDESRKFMKLFLGNLLATPIATTSYSKNQYLNHFHVLYMLSIPKACSRSRHQGLHRKVGCGKGWHQ